MPSMDSDKNCINQSSRKRDHYGETHLQTPEGDHDEKINRTRRKTSKFCESSEEWIENQGYCRVCIRKSHKTNAVTSIACNGLVDGGERNVYMFDKRRKLMIFKYINKNLPQYITGSHDNPPSRSH